MQTPDTTLPKVIDNCHELFKWLSFVFIVGYLSQASRLLL